MILNPEFRRNLWLEFTPQRLIVTPIIISAILYLSYLTTGAASQFEIVKVTALSIFLFYLFLWGTKAASESIPDEINHNTWDIQRLSAIKPWTLAWGKLLGSTAYTWYGAIIALIPYLIITLLQAKSGHEQSSLPFLQLGVYLIGGLFAHSLALLSSMNVLQQDKRIKVKTYRYLLVGLLGSWIFVSPTLNLLHQPLASTINWYQFQVSSFTFFFSSLCLFLGWTLVGIIRNMRQALQYHSQPWAWLTFTLFCMIYFSGLVDLHSFVPDMTLLTQNSEWAILKQTPKYIAFSIAGLLTYVSVFSEKINSVIYKKLFIKKQFPRWSASFLLVLLMGIWICFTPKIEYFAPAVFSISSLLLITRDILIIHYFQFSNNPKRALLTAAFYMAVLYILIPSLLLALHASTLLPLFVPGGVGDYKILSFIGPGLQVAFMGWMLRQRFIALDFQRQ